MISFLSVNRLQVIFVFYIQIVCKTLARIYKAKMSKKRVLENQLSGEGIKYRAREVDERRTYKSGMPEWKWCTGYCNSDRNGQERAITCL